MRSLRVVKLEVFSQPGLGSVEVGIGLQIDIFIFDCAPQSFRKDIVHTPASTIHADLNVLIEE